MSEKVSALDIITSAELLPTDNLYVARANNTERRLELDTIEKRLVGTEFFAENYATLQLALTAIGSTVCELIISTTLNATLDTTVPINVILRFVGDGKLNVSATKNVIINSDSRGWPLKSIFIGSGGIKFGTNVGVAFPQWFGMIADGNVANAGVNTVAIQKCLDAFNPITLTLYTDVSRAGIVELTGGAWINDTITMQFASHTLRGQGWGTAGAASHRSYLRAADALVGKPMIKVTDSWGTGIEKLFIIGNVANKPSCAIEFAENPDVNRPHGLDFSYLSHVYIGDMYGYNTVVDKQLVDGIIFTGLVDGDSNSFRHVSINGCTGSGIDVTGNTNASDTHWDSLIITNCGIGFKAGAFQVGTNWLFALNDVDISMVGAGTQLLIRHFGSEGSKRLATMIGAAARLVITGGSWQAGDNFTPADVGNNRYFIDAVSGGTSQYVHLEDFQLFISGVIAKNPVVRIGSAGSGGSGSFLRLISTNIDSSKILVEAISGFILGATVESVQNITNAEIPQLYSRVTLDDKRGVEDNTFQFLRNDFLGKLNVFGGPLKVKKLFKPVGVNADPFVGSGATSYSYKITALTYDGETEPSIADTCSNAATLDSTHTNIITWQHCIGAYAYNVYGRTGGSELLIATVLADNLPSGIRYIDDGSITPSGALPTINTTGRLYACAPNLAPIDAQIDPHGFTFYLDETANKLMVRVKYSNGTTLKVGEIALV